MTQVFRATLSVRQAAQALGCSAGCVYRLWHSGELRGHTAGSRVRVYEDSLRAYIAAHENQAPAAPEPPAPRPRSTPRAGRGLQFFPH
jgi:excisionase family DNA binding protein